MSSSSKKTARPSAKLAAKAATTAKAAPASPAKPAKKRFVPTKKIEGEPGVLLKIAELPKPFAVVGKRLHDTIMRAAPELEPGLHYGMPWYSKNGKRVCFFRADRYMTFGLTEDANLSREDGAAHQLLASAWFFIDLDAATEAKIADIVRDATR